MKIIGSVGDGKLLVEAHKDELAKIAGYQYADYGDGAKALKFNIGVEIAVNALWQALEVTRGRIKEVSDLAAALRKTADRVDTINAALKAPIVEVKAT